MVLISNTQWKIFLSFFILFHVCFITKIPTKENITDATKALQHL